MTGRLHCDYCESREPSTNHVVGWFRLERIGQPIAMQDAPGPFDFCSLRCVWEWSANERNQGRA